MGKPMNLVITQKDRDQAAAAISSWYAGQSLVDQLSRAIATARDEGRAEQREVDAKKADAIAQGRERQKAEYRAAKLTREARDFETMAMEASYVAAAIRKGEP